MSKTGELTVWQQAHLSIPASAASPRHIRIQQDETRFLLSGLSQDAKSSKGSFGEMLNETSPHVNKREPTKLPIYNILSLFSFGTKAGM